MGIGYCLVQTMEGSKDPLLIAAGSRSFNPAENNYAVVELELLAVQWAVNECQVYLVGPEFLIVMDHRSLLGILNRENLVAVNNICIQRLLVTLLGYRYKVGWVPGNIRVIAGALSRAPVFGAEGHENVIMPQEVQMVRGPVGRLAVQRVGCGISMWSYLVDVDGRFLQPGRMPGSLGATGWPFQTFQNLACLFV